MNLPRRIVGLITFENSSCLEHLPLGLVTWDENFLLGLILMAHQIDLLWKTLKFPFNAMVFYSFFI